MRYHYFYFSQPAQMSLVSLFRLVILAMGIIVACSNVHGASPEDPKGRMRLSDLRCEHLTEPLGVDNNKPRLSWKLQSEVRGQFQSAYRVIVASTKAILASGAGDMWDSGKVDSDATVDVRYDG